MKLTPQIRIRETSMAYCHALRSGRVAEAKRKVRVY
jgi:hypothetical protein